MIVPAAPLKSTLVALSGKRPERVTVAPNAPDEGEKAVMTGGIRNKPADVFVPAGVATVIGPLGAFTGTVAMTS